MIRIFLGNPGSGKTACMVRELAMFEDNRPTYANITAKIKNVVPLRRDMIIEKVNDGKKEERRFNIGFWQQLLERHHSINVCLDEAHTLLNPRRAMSKTNIIMTDFLALMRRILGSNEAGYGTLTLITQLDRRLDPIAKEMCRHVRYHICHYLKSCTRCGYSWREHSDLSEPFVLCPKCQDHHMTKHSHVIEVWHFQSMDHYQRWHYFSEKTYHKHYIVNDIEKYFPLYNTLQWENLISDY